MKNINLRYTSIALSVMAASALSVTNVNAQEVKEEIVVTGTRATIQSSIDQKRISTEIVDGLTSDEIGDIPALSIGEALSTLTGVSTNRENGGASETSIRGLGPFLTNTTINGREVSSGNGTRATNFSIFPSELFNKIGVFKTQSASFIEGAVAGQVRLETKRPIDHGKQSIQLNAKAAFNQNERDIDGGDDVGYRGTISYIDQFETENFGKFGVSIGAQIREESNPEQEFTTSGTPRICNLDENRLPGGGSCSDAQNFLRGLTPDSDGNFATDEDRENFAFLASSARFRQNVTSDEREALFTAFQWQPNDKLDINLDLQFSERDRSEERSDLEISEFNRNLDNVDANGDPITVVSADGVLQSFSNDVSRGGQEVRITGQNFDQVEEFKGFGLNLEYQVNDDLKVSFDASYSDTERVETELAVQLGDNRERLVSFDSTGGVPIIGIVNPDESDFDPTNLGEFIVTDIPGDFSIAAITDASVVGLLDGLEEVDRDGENLTNRQRFRSQVDVRENTISALRGDFELQTHDLGIVKSIEGGVRFSELEYRRSGNVTVDTEISSLGGDDDVNNEISFEVLSNIGTNCVDLQPESGFLSEELDGRQLGSNFDDFLSIDVDCSLAQALSVDGVEFDDVFQASDNLNGRSIDVEESTFSAYLQANYEATLFGLPARGNFGLRAVSTTVDSTTFRGGFEIDPLDNGQFELDTASQQRNLEIFNDEEFGDLDVDSSSFTELLPSASLVVDLSDNVLFRTGIFRGISRVDPAILGERQQVGSIATDILGIATGDDGDTEIEDITTEDIVGLLSSQTTTGGSVDLDPFTSWNVDFALEWYPNKDTILAAGVYYKRFRGGFENTVTDSEFFVALDGDGNEGLATDFGDNGVVTAPVNTIQRTDETSNLYGIELTASHAFTYLPGFLGGFGTKLSYNYASSDFEFEDDFAGGGVGLNQDGELQDLIPLIAPSDIFGLSRNVASAQLYWSGGPVNAQVIVKHRSEFFQQLTQDPGRIRFIDDNTVVEFKASYRLNDTIKLSFEALNLTDEVRRDFRAIDGNVNQVISFGPRFFFGIQAKL